MQSVSTWLVKLVMFPMNILFIFLQNYNTIIRGTASGNTSNIFQRRVGNTSDVRKLDTQRQVIRRGTGEICRDHGVLAEDTLPRRATHKDQNLGQGVKKSHYIEVKFKYQSVWNVFIMNDSAHKYQPWPWQLACRKYLRKQLSCWSDIIEGHNFIMLFKLWRHVNNINNVVVRFVKIKKHNW